MPLSCRFNFRRMENQYFLDGGRKNGFMVFSRVKAIINYLRWQVLDPVYFPSINRGADERSYFVKK